MMIIFKSTEDVREEIQGQIGVIPDVVWEQLIEQRRPQDLVDDSEPQDQEELLQDLSRACEELTELHKTRPERFSRKPRSPAEDDRLEVLPFVAAAQAARDRELHRFWRQNFNTPKPLTPEGAEGWIHRQAETQGPPEIRVTVPIGVLERTTDPVLSGVKIATDLFPKPWNHNLHSRLPRWVQDSLEMALASEEREPSEIFPFLRRFELSSEGSEGLSPTYAFETETLEVLGVGSVPIASGSPLAMLRQVAWGLQRSLGFSESEWSWFCLTQTPPLAPRPQFEVSIGANPLQDKICLNLPVSTHRTEMERVFREGKTELQALRQEELGPSFRYGQRLASRAVRLASFAAVHNDGRTWDDLQSAWMDQGEDVATTKPNFIRDVRDAYARVTGKPLIWKRRQGTRSPCR